jgi:carbonic anhydrase
MKLKTLSALMGAALFTAAFSTTTLASDHAEHGHDVHWGYAGHEGPEYWGDLKADFATCKTGQKQSPVNLTKMQQADLEPIKFHYQASNMGIINNGHTIQANFDKGSYIEVDGIRFDLLQVHFHTPSENHIAGHSYPMEAHFVHKSADGQLAVVAVMIREGNKDNFIQKIWNHMPKHAGPAHTVEGVKFNAIEFLPAFKGYYKFSGSLTTPPCTEGVRWLVMKNAAYASPEQVAQFTKVIGHNNRPVQPLHGRTIQQ